MKTSSFERYMIIAMSVDLRYIPERHQRNTFRLCALELIQSDDIEDFFVVLYEALKVNNIKIPIHYDVHNSLFPYQKQG